MYKYLLVALNAKFIHSNLGIYSIEAYLKLHNPNLVVEKLESNINHNAAVILQGIYESGAEAVGFSTYIWNIEYVLLLVRNLRKLCPNVTIILGGPEVTYKAIRLMEEYPEIDFIIKGEGEKSSSELLQYLCRDMDMRTAKHGSRISKEVFSGEQPGATDCSEIPGLCYRNGGKIAENDDSSPMDMDELPFVYPNLGREFTENRIIYYESSRGCPFRCSYCLSSIGSDLKFRGLDKVKREMQYFLDNEVKQVKFVDRTFNAKKSHSLEILKYIKEHDNGVTNFHFEMEGDILSEEEIALLTSMRAGQVQLEIGVQTTNERTLREIRRFADTNKLEDNMRKLRTSGNMHLHLDLIAGLPFEDFSSFQASFNRVYAMKPDELQLGFLKVLDGSHMWEMEEKYKIKRFDTPPYEILSNHWIQYPELLILKAVEEMLEVYYNSRQFEESMTFLEGRFETAFAMYEAMAGYYKRRNLFPEKHNRMKRYEILYDFCCELLQSGKLSQADLKHLRDLLTIDLYKREKVKSGSPFCMQDRSRDPNYKELFRKECIKRGLKNHEAHLELLGNGRRVFFDYTRKSPLSNNAVYFYV